MKTAEIIAGTINMENQKSEVDSIIEQSSALTQSAIRLLDFLETAISMTEPRPRQKDQAEAVLLILNTNAKRTKEEVLKIMKI